MANRAVLWITTQLKWVRSRVRNGKNVHSSLNNKDSSQSIRSIMYNHCEGCPRFSSTSERTRALTGPAADNYSQYGSTLKEAAAKLNHGIFGNSYAYNKMLTWCSKEKDLETVKQMHEPIKNSQMEQDPYVSKTLLRCYIECGKLESALEIFHKLLKKDTVTWNMMIAGCVKCDKAERAIKLYNQMRLEGVQRNALTYLSVLKACASPTALKWGEEIHTHIVLDGFLADVRVCTALVRMYAKCGSKEVAKTVFGNMGRRNVISWNVMIGGLAEHGLGREAFSLFLQMQREGFTPNVITYLSILHPSSSPGAVEWVKQVHAQSTEGGLDSDVRLGNALVQMYAKTGLISDAKRVFDKMRSRDVISWVVMIGGLAQHGRGREALQLFDEMKLKAVKPNDSLFVAVLSACSHAGLVDEGRMHFDSMRRDHGIEPGLGHYNTMVDMLGRAGCLMEAKHFILNMPIKPDRVTWAAFLGACRTHKNTELAEFAARECLKLNPADAAVHVLLSNVYAAVGNFDQVSLIRGLMDEKGIRKDPGQCWIAVGDTIHYFQVGDTTHPESREIYTTLSRLSRKLKAQGYNPDTRLVLRNIAEEDKESLLCSHSEKLAIAYGLMRVPPEEPIRVYKNLRICADCHTATKLISKVTGRVIVARDLNRFHHFEDGSCSCGDYW